MGSAAVENRRVAVIRPDGLQGAKLGIDFDPSKTKEVNAILAEAKEKHQNTGWLAQALAKVGAKTFDASSL